MTMTTGQHLFRFNIICFALHQPLKDVLHLFQCTTIWNQSSDRPLRCLDVNLCLFNAKYLKKADVVSEQVTVAPIVVECFSVAIDI